MRALTVKISGGSSVLVPMDFSLLTPYVLLEQEDWFEDEIRFLRTVLKPGQSVLDIGANYGCYTLSLAQIVGSSGAVTAVEPGSQAGSYLEQSARLNSNSNIHVIRGALGAMDGIARLAQSPNPELNHLTDNNNDPTAQKVRLSKLDTIAKGSPALGNISFVKLDAEGSEFSILNGGRVVFESQSPIVMFERMHGSTANNKLIDAFESTGYRIFSLAPGLGILTPYEPSRADIFNLNLFALKPDRIAEASKEGWLTATVPAAQTPTDLASPFFADGDAINRYAQMRAIESMKFKSTNVPGLFLLARTALAIGRRGAAVNLLYRALKTAQSSKLKHDDIIVPPDPLLDADIPKDAGTEWGLAAAISSYERARAFSSYFTQPATLPLLQWVSTTPYHTPEMERRLQLIQLRTGQREHLAEHPIFINADTRHLNRQVWLGDCTTTASPALKKHDPCVMALFQRTIQPQRAVH